MTAQLIRSLVNQGALFVRIATPEERQHRHQHPAAHVELENIMKLLFLQTTAINSHVRIVTQEKFRRQEQRSVSLVPLDFFNHSTARVRVLPVLLDFGPIKLGVQHNHCAWNVLLDFTRRPVARQVRNLATNALQAKLLKSLVLITLPSVRIAKRVDHQVPVQHVAQSVSKASTKERKEVPAVCFAR